MLTTKEEFQEIFSHRSTYTQKTLLPLFHYGYQLTTVLNKPDSCSFVRVYPFVPSSTLHRANRLLYAGLDLGIADLLGSEREKIAVQVHVRKWFTNSHTLRSQKLSLKSYMSQLPIAQ